MTCYSRASFTHEGAAETGAVSPHGTVPSPQCGGEDMSEHEHEETPAPETQEQDGTEPEAPMTPERLAEDEEESGEVEGQEGEQGEHEPDEEPQARAGEPRELSQKEIEGRLDKLNREGERHAKRVHEIMEEAMSDLTMCELCWPFAPGFRFEPIPDKQRAQVMLVLGMSSVGDYAEDTHSQACADCRGFGVVATGSKVSGQEALTCLNCNGRGWMGDRAVTGVVYPMQELPAEPDNGAPATVPQSAEVEQAAAAARAAGLIVIDPHAATTS